MSWLLVVLGAHLLNAGSLLTDKILLRRAVPSPAAYILSIGLLSGVVGLVAAPFVPWAILPAGVLVVAAFSGAAHIGALYAFFATLQRGEATRVIPVVNALIPLWGFLFASALLGETLSSKQWFGISILVLSGLLLSYQRREQSASSWATRWGIILAAALFAFSFATAKFTFDHADFWPAFIWMRIFGLLTVLPLVFNSQVRATVLGASQQKQTGLAFLAGQAMGAAAFVLLNFGVSLSPSVTIVNALAGVQQAFIFILVLILARRAPQLLDEDLSSRVLAQKVLALIGLIIGLVFVA